MIVTSTTYRDLIHWMLLWILAALVVAVMQGHLAGARPAALGPQSPPTPIAPDQTPGQPIPMPNVDHPDEFRYPHDEPHEVAEVSLAELLLLHRQGRFEEALRGWQKMEPVDDSRTWRQTAMGVVNLRSGQLEEARQCLERAVELNPANAVAEYFLGRVRQAEGRAIPFWYEKDDDAEFHLASTIAVNPVPRVEPATPPGQNRPRMFLPHFIDDAFDRLARQHFRRAVVLSPRCPLDQPIRMKTKVEPMIQLAVQSINEKFNREPGDITVGELLESFGERDFVRKAKAELGAPRIH